MADQDIKPDNTSPDDGKEIRRPPVPYVGVNLQAQLSEGNYIKVNRSDVLPEAEKNPLFAWKDKQGNDLPVYLNVGKDASAGDEGKASLMHDIKGGAPFIEINEAYHKWTPEYLRNHLMMANAELEKITSLKDAAAMFSDALPGMKVRLANQQSIANKAASSLAEEISAFERGEKLVASIYHMEKKRGLKDTELRLYAPDPFQAESSMAAAGQTKEGKNFIAIDSQVFAEAVASDKKASMLLANVGHELSHIVNRDVTPELAAVSRDVSITRRQELLADLGARQPDALADNRAQSLYSHIARYNEVNHADISDANPTIDQLRAVSRWNQHAHDKVHPEDMLRISALELQSALLTAYEKTHPVKTPEDHKTKHAWIIEQIMTQVEHKTLPESASLKAATSLPDHVKALAQGMATLPMQEAKIPTVPASAPVPEKQVTHDTP